MGGLVTSDIYLSEDQCLGPCVYEDERCLIVRPTAGKSPIGTPVRKSPVTQVRTLGDNVCTCI